MATSYTQNLPSTEEARLIKEVISLSDSSPKSGAIFFLINLKWWNRWKDYSNFSGKGTTANRPDGIDNTELLDQEGELKSLQMEGNNYALLPAAAWSMLLSWYGGGPAIKRHMIGVPFTTGGQIQLKFEVEVYLVEIRARRANWPMSGAGSDVILRLSRFATTKKLLQAAASKFLSAPHRSKYVEYTF